MALRQIFFIIKRYAGHSKWQNIRHIKGEKDMQRSVLFVKLAQQIRIAIKENGNNANPALNTSLASAIDIAKSKNMPLASIQNAIKSTQTDKDAAQPFRYSIRGPRGSILLVTALSTSQRKTKIDIQTCLNKVGGILADQSLENHFEKKGILVVPSPPDIDNVEEASVDHAIEAGAEEVSPLDDNKKLTFTCAASELHRVKAKLEELKYQVEEAKITFVPKMKVSLNDNEMELVSNIISKLQTIEEVTEIQDNIE